jgi:hypothetical protein
MEVDMSYPVRSRDNWEAAYNSYISGQKSQRLHSVLPKKCGKWKKENSSDW